MRYFIGFMVTIFLLILIIFLIVTGGSKTPKVTARQLDSYATTSAIASMSIAGPITAQSTHNEVLISVGRDQVTYEQISGYDNNVVLTKTYENTEASYYAFLRALNTAGFTKGDRAKAVANEQGICPLGQRYVFALDQDGTQLQRFWSTNCGSHTYGGNTSTTLTLFQAQVPDYNTLTQNVQLN
jgi:hypothetical protein